LFGTAVDGLLHHALHLVDVRFQTGAIRVLGRPRRIGQREVDDRELKLVEKGGDP